jgi:hypothetical protein
LAGDVEIAVGSGQVFLEESMMRRHASSVSCSDPGYLGDETKSERVAGAMRPEPLLHRRYRLCR